MLQDIKPKAELAAKVRFDDNKSLEFFIAVFALLLLGILRQFFPQYLSSLFTSLNVFGGNKRVSNGQLENDTRASFGFYILYIINLIYVLYVFLKHISAGFQHASFRFFIPAVLLVLILVGLKNLVMRIISWIFKQEVYAKKFFFNNMIVNEVVGMLLVPCSLLLLLSKGLTQQYILYFALIVLAGAYAIKAFKNLGILKNLLRIDFVHFLLYLCAFEIVPAWIIVKVVFRY